MKIRDGRITFLFNHNGATIELHDSDSSATFVKIELTEVQVCTMFSRLGYTETESMEVFNLDRLNKKLVTRSFSFEIPENCSWSNDRDKVKKLAVRKCPAGWEPDLYFNSQGSFFHDGKKFYARTTIRKWVERKIKIRRWVEKDVKPLTGRRKRNV